ncbi:hypothetical protein [Fusobacterium perfoetens]|uniref:hypothetical protein n=1 Tax=Fusobacterium perfoetens TaxID=852 RepID=UPI000486A867|nr:hypothetical protein [Fusobacterium perfoetens]
MENLYDKLWENTKTWKFDPFVFIVCLFTLKNYLISIPLNLSILIFYCMLSEKYTIKHSKKFFLSYLLWGIVFLILIIIITVPVIFFLGFDDAGSISSETKTFIMSGSLPMIFSSIKILFSVILSYKSQKCKRLAYEEYEESKKGEEENL